MHSERSTSPPFFLVSAFLTTLLLAGPSPAKTYSTAEVNQLLSRLQADIKSNGYHYTVGQTSVIGFSVDEICKLDINKEGANAAPQEPRLGSLNKTLSVPDSFDWNAAGKCTPIKDQGNCGSCWAFASTGSYESALKIFNAVSTDLSEQFLVYCNSNGNGCNGGSCAFGAMTQGTPLEACAPYGGSQTGCQCQKYFPIQASYSVAGDAASLKQAIYNHGGIYASVAATDAFLAYTGGIFDNNDLSAKSNHAIVLVGWNDAKGAWRLRNSWGAKWGEAGYMWITYGCLKVGLYAQYAVPAPSALQLAAPANLTATSVSLSQINLSWTNPAGSPAGFYIERATGTGAFSQIAALGPAAVAYSNTGLVANTMYSYRIRAYVGQQTSDYSNQAVATTSTLPAPSNLAAAVVSQTQVSLSWKNNAAQVDGFAVERRTDSGEYRQVAVVGSRSVVYTDVGLSANGAYVYRVRAFAYKSLSNYSAEASVSTRGIFAPVNLTATAVSSSQINLAWQATGASAAGFYVECKIGSGSYSQVGTIPATVTAISNTYLAQNTTYSYRLRAFSGQAVSPYSNEATATTPSRKTLGVSEATGGGPVELSIINAQGNCIMRTLIAGGFNTADIPLFVSLAPGFYIARTKSESGVFEQRFVVHGRRIAAFGAQ